MTTLFQVDAFTSTPFTGNPAGVCLLGGAAPEQWMQHIAAEMNLAETAFVFREQDHFNIRYFTPTTEVPLCGHATLASAHILWQQNILAPHEPAVFQAPAGRLTAQRRDDWIALDFPAYAATPAANKDELNAVLGSKPVGLYRTDNRWYVAELASAADVKEIRPDLGLLRKVDAGALIVTAAGGPSGCDFVLRFFAPSMGIDEDPATGSAHCVLGPYWSDRLGKPRMNARQLSARGGTVRVEVQPDGKRVQIEGQAVTIFELNINSGVPLP